ncbi:MAG: DNA polymerase I [Phycisphaeraceae bacterium]|nr:DNA polymerase I [Phycisphaeraceae bacterium]
MPTLYIIDGYAQFFRAYHAIRTPMTSPVTKEPTNMTFGFIGMLLKLLRGQDAGLKAAGKPDYIAVALDVSGDRGTFRSQIYPPYKAHRPPPPEDLEQQVERCLKVLNEVGVPVIGAEGFEADDVIATLTRRLRREHPDLKIRIISKDKDLKQLLEAPADSGGLGAVALFDVHTDLGFDAGALKAATGLNPSQVVDMLTLMGDTSDNVPGVDGVGEKTAAALIAEWGTLENLLANAHTITGKRGEKLRDAAPRLSVSKELVTLRDDLPLSFDLQSARAAGLHLDRLLPQLKELGFNRYQDEVRALLDRGTSGESTGDAPPGAGAKPVSKKTARDDGGLFAGGLFADVEARQREETPLRAQAGEYRCVRTRAELDALLASMREAPVVSIDTETTSLSPREAKLCGISVSVRSGEGWYIPVRSPTPEDHLDEATVLNALRPILEDGSKAKCGHNLKYDLLIFRAAGVELTGLDAPGACDSMVASYLIDASRSSHGLDALALALLGRTNISITELIGSGKSQRTFDTVPLDMATQYAAEDADVALQLCERMMPALADMDLMSLMRGVEMPLVEVLASLEWNGIRVDPDELERQRVRLQEKINQLKQEIDACSLEHLDRTFDPDSPKQLATALFNKPTDEPPGLGIAGQKRTKTGYSTDAEVLESLAEDDSITISIPRLILEYRQLTKLVSTYLVALKAAIHPSTGRVHASFHQTVATTGRLASSDPNLQNIPIRTDVGRDIRRAFVAEPGNVLITADYSQIELRLLAHLSRDPALIAAFERDEDIHTAVAAQIHGIAPTEVTREQRSGAKMVNFGIVYGITAYGLARRLKVPQDQAAAIIDGYKRRFSGITTFLQECVEQARTQGFVTTMLGRRRPIPEIDAKNPSRRSLAERLAINSVVQGSAADLIKVAMVDLHRRFRAGEGAIPAGAVKMLLQIHDELVFEGPESLAEEAKSLVSLRMEQAAHLRVPLKAEAHASNNWFEGK